MLSSVCRNERNLRRYVFPKTERDRAVGRCGEIDDAARRAHPELRLYPGCLQNVRDGIHCVFNYAVAAHAGNRPVRVRARA